VATAVCRTACAASAGTVTASGESRYGPFLGCTNYREGSGCRAAWTIDGRRLPIAARRRPHKDAVGALGRWNLRTAWAIAGVLVVAGVAVGVVFHAASLIVGALMVALAAVFLSVLYVGSRR
jgi:hypothetical protein